MALAKGQRYGTVIWKHAFRNVLLMLSTVAGTYFIAMFTGAAAVEMLCGMPGLMAGLVSNTMMMRNLQYIQAALILTGATATLLNLAVDIIYGFADPRVKSYYK